MDSDDYAYDAEDDGCSRRGAGGTHKEGGVRHKLFGAEDNEIRKRSANDGATSVGGKRKALAPLQAGDTSEFVSWRKGDKLVMVSLPPPAPLSYALAIARCCLALTMKKWSGGV